MISPHLDDAALSLGAAIAHTTRVGGTIRIVTVLAGDETATFEAGPWDRSSGFETAGEAARARGEEDDVACRILGALPVRLPYFDKQYGRGGEDREILAAVLNAIAGCDLLLLPGFPLNNEDHDWLARLLLEGSPRSVRIGLYAEQPYAARARETPAAILEPGGPWLTLEAATTDQFVKLRACRAYRSQIEPLGGLRVLLSVLKYEAQRGGESISWLEDQERRLR